MDTSDDFDLYVRRNGALDDVVWATIAERYRGLLIAWAVRCPATATTGESAEEIADQALTRAWLALSSKDHAAFPNLAALLSYLHMCVTATAIDVTRAQAVQARTARSLAAHESTDPEQALLDQLEHAELWRLVNNLITTEQERVILVERYVLDLPPRRILARHPTLFADVRAIYSAVRNLCCRLGRHRDLRQLWDDRIAA